MRARAAGAWVVPSSVRVAALRPEPCPLCTELVSQFAYATPNPLWRAVLRKRL